MPISAPLLRVENLSVSYGQIPALRNVSLSVEAGSIVAILGANGAGKTTLLKALSGLVKVATGSIQFDGRDITGLKPHRIARIGLVHVPEGRRVLVPLSVEDNLLVAARAGGHASRAEASDLVAAAFEMFPRLAERRRVASGQMSGGEQQMMALARAIVMQPKLIIMDEPSMGLAPIIVRQIYQLLSPGSLLRQKATILLAEQSVNLALDVAEYAYILTKGVVASAGDWRGRSDRSELVNAYLRGSGEETAKVQDMSS